MEIIENTIIVAMLISFLMLLVTSVILFVRIKIAEINISNVDKFTIDIAADVLELKKDRRAKSFAHQDIIEGGLK